MVISSKHLTAALKQRWHVNGSFTIARRRVCMWRAHVRRVYRVSEQLGAVMSEAALACL